MKATKQQTSKSQIVVEYTIAVIFIVVCTILFINSFNVTFNAF